MQPSVTTLIGCARRLRPKPHGYRFLPVIPLLQGQSTKAICQSHGKCDNRGCRPQVKTGHLPFVFIRTSRQQNKNPQGALNVKSNPLKLTRRGLVVATAGIVGAHAVKSAYGQEPQETAPPKQDGPTEADFQRDYEAPTFKPSWSKKQINRQMLQDFVIFAHSDLAMTKTLLEREPALLNGAMDWGAGDFETALGGASHMGRHDIVEYLLERGARIDLFCAAMMGHLEAVKSFLTSQPALIDAKGPHGFSLHFHAQVGAERSAAVLEYLQSVKQIELKPVPFLKNKEK
jgi:hypothetical protein